MNVNLLEPLLCESKITGLCEGYCCGKYLQTVPERWHLCYRAAQRVGIVLTAPSWACRAAPAARPRCCISVCLCSKLNFAECPPPTTVLVLRHLMLPTILHLDACAKGITVLQPFCRLGAADGTFPADRFFFAIWLLLW